MTSQNYVCVRSALHSIFLVVKSDCVFRRLEYTVCNCDYLWNHHGYWRNSVGNMFLHGKVRIACNTSNVFHMSVTLDDCSYIKAHDRSLRRSIFTLLTNTLGSFSFQGKLYPGMHLLSNCCLICS